MKSLPFLVGFLAALLCLLARLLVAPGGWDLAWALQAARLLFANQNPYTATGYPKGLPLFYPLPALLLVAPFAAFDPLLGSVLFSWLSATALAAAVLAKRPSSWPIFLSAPFIIAVIWSQWAPLLCAAILIPDLFFVVLAKPTLGLSVLLARFPARRQLLICAALLLISVLLLPSWPLDWLRNTSSHDSTIAVLTLPGVLLLLALPFWRDERARLLLGLSLVPLRFYDCLSLWLIPERPRDGLYLSALSWVVCGPWLWRNLLAQSHPLDQPSMMLVVGWMYLPALAFVLLRQRTAR